MFRHIYAIEEKKINLFIFIYIYMEPIQLRLPNFEKIQQVIRPSNEQILKLIRSYQEQIRLLKRDALKLKEQMTTDNDEAIDTTETELEHAERELHRLYSMIRPEES